MNKWTRNILPVFLSGIWLLLPVYSIAQSPVIEISEIEDVLLVQQTMVYTDSTNNLDINKVVDVFKNNEFRAINEYGIPISTGNYNTWVHMKVKNTSDHLKRLVFEIPMSRLDSFEVYSVYQNEIKYWGKCYGTGLPVSTKPMKTLSHAIAYNLEANAGEDIFINLRRFPYVLVNNVRIYDQTAFFRFESKKYAKLFFVYGLFVFIVFLSLVFYFASRRKYLLLLPVTLAVKVFFLSYIFGIFSFFDLDYIATSGFVYLIIVLQYWYSKVFFSRPYSLKLIIILLLVWFLHCLFYPLFKNTGFDYSAILSVGIILVTCLLFFDLVTHIKRKVKFAWLFLFSQLPSVFSVLLNAFNNMMGFFSRFYKENDYDILYYNTLVDSLLFIIVILYRVWLLNLEKIRYLDVLSVLRQRVIDIQDSERQKIAADLHDDLGSTLAVLKDKIESGSKDALPVVQKAMNDLRSISHQLMPHEFDLLGFKGSLERFVGESNRQAGMHISLVFYGETTHLPADKELNVYRILTELIHNSRKHSKASRLAIELTCRPDCLYVSFAELDGESLPAAAQPGIGLRSITSRLEYLNATVLENSFTSTGYNLTFEIGV